MRSGKRPGFRWTDEAIVYAVQLWFRKHGRVPCTNEWTSAGENHPSRHTVSRVFGSWNAAMVAAGFNPRPRGRTPRSFSTAMCTQPIGLLNMLDEISAPEARERRGERRQHPNRSLRHGGSKIGYTWSHTLVGYALEGYHRRHLRMPTVNELRAGIDELPSYATVCKMYGTFGAMLRHHGFPVRPRGGRPSGNRSSAGFKLPSRLVGEPRG